MRIGAEHLRSLARLPKAASELAAESPVTAGAMLVAVVLFARVLVFVLGSLTLPLFVWEGHHWRQAFTYGVAWNFAHTTFDVFHPRMFVELASSNVVPMEPPLYPLLASVLLRLTGDSVVAPRLLSFGGLVATAVVLWRWLSVTSTDPKEPLAERAGLLVALALAPMTSVEFRAIQPEPFAAGLAIVAAFYCARYSETARRGDAVKGALLFALSLLAKPVALGIAPGLVLFASWGGKGALRRTLVVGSMIAVAVLPWTLWDRWAHFMLERDLLGAWVIEIGHPPKALLASIISGQWTRVALLEHLPTFATSWWLTPAIAFGMYRGLAERRWRRHAVPFLVWLAGYAVQLLAIGIRLHSNAYYVILGGAPLAYFAALGLGAVVRLLDARRSPVPATTFRTGVGVALLLPLGWAFSRPSSWSNTIDFAELGFDRNRFVWTSDLGLARLLVVFVILLGAGAWLRPRRVPTWFGGACALVIALAGVRPANDALQYFRFYIAADRRAGFDAELAKLRSAVAQASTLDERILLSPGGTYREPLMIYYYYALRNGFPFRQPADEKLALERGARLLLKVDQLEGTEHVPLASTPVLGHTAGTGRGRTLASGAWWRMICIAKEGCAAP